MRRSISLCEPATCLAGQMLSWKFHHTPATTLPKGAKLRFDLVSQNRDIDWQTPKVDLSKKATDVIYMELPSGEIVAAKEAKTPSPSFDFTLPKEVKSGTTLTIFMGAYAPNGKDAGEGEIAAQNYTQRRRTFNLYIDPKGKTQFDDAEEFHLDIKGNLLENIRVLTPAFVTRGKRFDVTIRFEDQFGNLTGFAPDDTLIELSYEHLRENLNWKLFVPETGFITLPNLYFNEPGTYRIQLKNLETNHVSFSAPIRCYAEDSAHLLWGSLHSESEKVDTLEEPESSLRHFRDEACFNFYGTSASSHDELLTPDLWKSLSNQVAEFNEEDRFGAFLGYLWTGSSPKEGNRLITYSKDARPLYRSDDIKTNTLKKLYKSIPAKETISTIIFPMSPTYGFNMEDVDSDFERLVEIYTAWGCSECSHKEGNPRPISMAPGKVKELESGSIRHALNRGLRFGFVAGGLDDRGIFENFFDSTQVQYTPGITAVISKSQTRDHIFEALYKRQCYATTGERILMDFLICGNPMGSELNAIEKPGLVINRYLHGFVAGTAEISHVEVIRCGQLWQTIKAPESCLNMELALDDMSPPSQIALNKETKPFIYYYLRVFQKDGHMAWSSPIWVDFSKEQVMPRLGGEVKAAVESAEVSTKSPAKAATKSIKSSSSEKTSPKAASKPAAKSPAKPAAKSPAKPAAKAAPKPAAKKTK
jgi:hypothetical protein